jgi:hypothetical protein
MNRSLVGQSFNLSVSPKIVSARASFSNGHLSRSLLARAIVLGLEVLGEGPCADGYACLETILVGRTEMNPAIKTAQCCFLRSGGEVGKTAPERELQGANLIRPVPP